jgi:putative membrane protein
MPLVGRLPGYGEMDWGWGHHLLWGGLVMVLFWLLVIAAIVLLVRAFTDRRQPPARPGPSAADAERILAERYARGEIDEQEYRARLTVLREHGSP